MYISTIVKAQYKKECKAFKEIGESHPLSLEDYAQHIEDCNISFILPNPPAIIDIDLP